MLKRKAKRKAPEVICTPVPEITGDYQEGIQPYLRDPYAVAALTVAALAAFAENREACYQQLAILKQPLRMLPRDRESIRLALEGKSQILRSYLRGATPENGYTPRQPLEIICDISPLALIKVEILKIAIHSAGDPVPRTLSLRLSDDCYYVWDYSELLLEVAPPTALPSPAEGLTGSELAEKLTREAMAGIPFPIGCWTYYPLSRVYPGVVRDWHELGLNNPLTPSFSEGDSKADMLRLLDECDDYGMKVFLFDERTGWRVLSKKGEAEYRRSVAAAVADFGSHPAVKGFYIGDEPDAPDAAAAFAAARICREMAPNLCPFLNLLPWFDWIGERIGSPAYAPYLDRAALEGDLKLLAYDCYAQMWEGDKGWDDYFNNLREHSLASRRNRIDFLPTLLSMGHYDYRCPSLDDFRWQLHTAAAFGAKGAYWFYVHQPSIDQNYRQPAINIFNERTRTYEDLSYVNRLFQRMYGSEMMRLTVRDFGFIGKAYGGCSLFQPDDIILGCDNSKDLPMLLNRFTDEEGKLYAVAVNLDLKQNATIQIHLAQGVSLYRKSFDKGYQPVQPLDDAVGKQSYSVGAQTYPYFMAPGQMELFRVL